MATLALRNVRKSYVDIDVVKGMNLEIRDKEFMVFVGPSGCGKSTTLRMIAGLEEITSGDLVIGERRVNDNAPADRDIAMVFQNYALYPHMTVEQNISFGLKQKRVPKDEIARRVADAARILEIEPLLQRKPRALSGGQRQRVAMGRAIVRNPEVFLFDEPLSNLDAKLRVQMRAEIKRLHKRLPTTTIYVTHDQVEAMTMADRVVVMNKGQIEQVGPPQELYNKPATKFVAGFIGSPAMNMIPVDVIAEGDALVMIAPGGQKLVVPAERKAAYAAAAGKPMLLGIRPEAVLRDQGSDALSVEVIFSEPLGSETLVYFSLGDAQYIAKTGPEFVPASGERVSLSLDLSRMHLIDPVTETVLATN